MDNYTPTSELFSFIRIATTETDLISLKDIACFALTKLSDENGYIKSLSIQLLCVCYIRYCELDDNKDFILRITENDIQYNGNEEIIAAIHPKNIINIINNIFNTVKESIQNKLNYIIERFASVPAFSLFYHVHSEYIDDFTKTLIFKKEDIENVISFNKYYSKYFYLHMIEVFNPYAYDADVKCPVSYTIAKYNEILDDLDSKLDKILKGKIDINIEDVASDVLLNNVYRYNDKTISLKTYNILARIYKHSCLVEKKNCFLINAYIPIELDINFLVILKGIAKYNNRDDKRVVKQLDNDFEKLVKDTQKQREKNEKNP